MSDVKRLVKSWINSNCCDGDDRSKADCDWHKFTAPELYEMGEDIAEMIQENVVNAIESQIAKLQAENDRLTKIAANKADRCDELFAEKVELIEALDLTLDAACCPCECSEDFCDEMLALLNKLQ